MPNSRLNPTVLGTLFGIAAFDTLLLAFAIPKLISEYGFTHSAAGFLGTVLMIGIGVGAIVLGALSDVVGRKKSSSPQLSFLHYQLACWP